VYQLGIWGVWELFNDLSATKLETQHGKKTKGIGPISGQIATFLLKKTRSTYKDRTTERGKKRGKGGVRTLTAVR